MNSRQRRKVIRAAKRLEKLFAHRCNDTLGYDKDGKCNWCGKVKK